MNAGAWPCKANWETEGELRPLLANCGAVESLQIWGKLEADRQSFYVAMGPDKLWLGVCPYEVTNPKSGLFTKETIMLQS